MTGEETREPLIALKQAAAAGNRESFERLVMYLQEIAVGMIRWRMDHRGDPYDLDDLRQEVLLRVVRGFTSCRATSDGELLSWLNTIAIRCIADHFRTKASSLVLNGIPMEGFPDQASESGQGSLKPLSPLEVAVFQAEAELPLDKRHLLRAKLLDGLTWSQIAEEFGITQAAAKRRWQRLERSFPGKVIEKIKMLPEEERAEAMEELELRVGRV